MKVIINDIKKLTFDDVCKNYNKDLSLKKGIKKMYVEYVYQLPSEITLPDASEIIGYFRGEENMWGYCIYYVEKDYKIERDLEWNTLYFK